MLDTTGVNVNAILQEFNHMIGHFLKGREFELVIEQELALPKYRLWENTFKKEF